MNIIQTQLIVAHTTAVSLASVSHVTVQVGEIDHLIQLEE